MTDFITNGFGIKSELDILVSGILATYAHIGTLSLHRLKDEATETPS